MIRRNGVIPEEKLKKVCDEFSLLSEGQQDYILGIIQALLFAKSENSLSEPENPENEPSF